LTILLALTLSLPAVLYFLTPPWITDLCLRLTCQLTDPCFWNKHLLLQNCLHLGLLLSFDNSTEPFTLCSYLLLFLIVLQCWEGTCK
jgi:hypothetical protein